MGWFPRLFWWASADPFSVSYEKSFANIAREVDRLQTAKRQRHLWWGRLRARLLAAFGAAWALLLGVAAHAHRAPHGALSARQHAARVLPALLAPVAFYALHRCLGSLTRLLDVRGDRRVAALQAKLRRMVAELKDASHWEKTLALLRQYDPDFAPPAQQVGGTARPRGSVVGGDFPPPAQQPLAPLAGAGKQPPPPGAGGGGGLPAPLGRAATAAANTLQGAGSRVAPLLAQIWTHAADTLIAEDPVMAGLLREAQREAESLRQRLVHAEAAAGELARANRQLWEEANLGRQQLGLPPLPPPPGAEAAGAPGEAGGEADEAAAAAAAPAASSGDSGKEAVPAPAASSAPSGDAEAGEEPPRETPAEGMAGRGETVQQDCGAAVSEEEDFVRVSPGGSSHSSEAGGGSGGGLAQRSG